MWRSWNNRDGEEYVAFVRGDVTGAHDVPVRLHWECSTVEAIDGTLMSAPNTVRRNDEVIAHPKAEGKVRLDRVHAVVLRAAAQGVCFCRCC